MEYELTSKDKKRISSWKGQGINTTDWNDVVKRYNNATTCERCCVTFKYYKITKMSNNKYYNITKMSSKVLDHNHNKLYNNIRGIICRGCNSSLRHIDNGTMPDLLK